MSKPLKSFLTRMIVYVILMCGIVAGINLYQASVAPTVTTELALGQMSDTDEGHIAMRAYTHASNNWVLTITLSIGAVLYILIVGGSTKNLLFPKEESKQKQNNK